MERDNHLEQRLAFAFDTFIQRMDRLEDRLEANSRELREAIRNLQITLIAGFIAVIAALLAFL